MKILSVTRDPKNPILARQEPHPNPEVGVNIMGSCIVKWQGKYWWYFSAHNGHTIRLMTAPSIAGPWTIKPGGVLSDSEVAPFRDTISAPDVHIVGNKLRMYAHTDVYGPLAPPKPKPAGWAKPHPLPAGWLQQFSFVAESTDGLKFKLVSTKNIAKYYLRAFPWNGKWYGLQKGWSTAPAELVVSPDGIQPFQHLKTFTSHGSIRHMAVKVERQTLIVAYTRIGDAPERIMFATIDLSKPDTQWVLSPPVVGFKPETPAEGSTYTPVPSFKGGGSHVNQLRDPYLFTDAGVTRIAYSGSGEDSLHLATITYDLNAQGAPETAAPPPGQGGSGGDGTGGGTGGGDGGGGNTGNGDNGNNGGDDMATKSEAQAASSRIKADLAVIDSYVSGASSGGTGDNGGGSTGGGEGGKGGKGGEGGGKGGGAGTGEGGKGGG